MRAELLRRRLGPEGLREVDDVSATERLQSVARAASGAPGGECEVGQVS
jgi:hypothetical protein